MTAGRKLLVNGVEPDRPAHLRTQGSFYAFPHVAATGLDDETFCNRLLQEEHVAVVPGNAFGLGGEGFARTCYATGYDQLERSPRAHRTFRE